MEINGLSTQDRAIRTIYPHGLPEYLQYILQKATYGYIWSNLTRQVKDPFSPGEYILMIDGLLSDFLLAPLVYDQLNAWESLKAFAAVCNQAYEAGKLAADKEWQGQDINLFSDLRTVASARSTRAKRHAIDASVHTAEEQSEELVHGLGQKLREILRDWFETGYMSYEVEQEAES